jgi:hypothetical protein
MTSMRSRYGKRNFAVRFAWKNEIAGFVRFQGFFEKVHEMDKKERKDVSGQIPGEAGRSPPGLAKTRSRCSLVSIGGKTISTEAEWNEVTMRQVPAGASRLRSSVLRWWPEQREMNGT